MQTNTQMGEGAKDTERGCAVTQKRDMQALVAYQQKNVVQQTLREDMQVLDCKQMQKEICRHW